VAIDSTNEANKAPLSSLYSKLSMCFTDITLPMSVQFSGLLWLPSFYWLVYLSYSPLSFIYISNVVDNISVTVTEDILTLAPWVVKL
jgi:hypothetical protein